MCTCCHRSNLPRYDCVIFLKQNYNFNIHAVANALPKRYRETRQKEFICKPCHKQLKDGNYTNNIENCSNSDMFESDIIHDQHTHHNVEQSITHTTNNITCDSRTSYTFQPTICTNYCTCTCCHNTDIPRLLWPIFVYCIVSMIRKWWFSYRYDADVLLQYQYIFSFNKLYLVACDLYFDSHKLLYLIITLIVISYFICINCIIVREYHRYSLTANKSLF